MKYLGFLIFYLLFFVVLRSYSQPNETHKDFQAPLDIPLLLAGTFGELRSNHFHSGLDIKTQKKENFEVKAIGSGFVKRIKISHGGFGKVLYIEHPNGYTSVYAHLKKFAPSIEAYVQKQQYSQETYEIELFPKSNALKINKGEFIALSGNTGSSSGPHLHFEIRETLSQKPINPLLLGFDVADHQRPIIQNLVGYPLSESSVINSLNTPIQLIFKKVNDSLYSADPVHAIGPIGFGINTIDRQDLAYNQNGIFKISTHLNGSLLQSFEMNKFSFKESSFINTFIDYPRMKTHRQKIIKLFKTKGNKLEFYTTSNKGSFSVKEGLNYIYSIKVSDFENNSVTLQVPVKGVEQIAVRSKEKKPGKIILTDRDYLYTFEKSSVYFAKNTFFEDATIDIKESGDTLVIENPLVPVYKNIKISYQPDTIQKGNYLGIVSGKKSIHFVSSDHKNGVFKARTKTLGKYILGRDTIPPTIEPVNFEDGKWVSNYRKLSFIIDDEGTGIGHYRGTIDGKWVLFEYEYKKKSLTFTFDDYPLEGTKHFIEISVKDMVGNSSQYNAVFYRKTYE